MRFTIAVAAILYLTGCYSRVPLQGSPAERQALLVRYRAATMVRLIAPGDTGRMVALRMLRGHGASISPDTIRLVVTRGNDADWEPVPVGSIAFVTLEPGTLIETVTFDSRKTANTLIGIVGVAAAIALLIDTLGPAFASNNY